MPGARAILTISDGSRAPPREVVFPAPSGGVATARLTIGRSADNDVVLDDPSRMTSRRQLELLWAGGRLWATCVGSGGTLLDGAAMPFMERLPLDHGNVIAWSGFVLDVRLFEATGGATVDWSDDPFGGGELREPPNRDFGMAAEGAAKGADASPSRFGPPAPAGAGASRREASAPPAPSPGRAPDPVEWPAPTGRGAALFRAPREMWVDVAELAELRLTAADPLAVGLRAALERSMRGRGRTEEHVVAPLGRRMRAVLHADARHLAVEPLSSETQDMDDGAALAWDWRVIPVRPGRSLMTLRVTMAADADGRERTVDAEALHVSVEIAARLGWTAPARFVRDNWRWLLGSSGLGAAAALVALWRDLFG